MNIFCSIIIVNWKSIDLLKNCLSSIRNCTINNYEIIVVDNASGKNEQRELKTIKNIKIICNSVNRGFAAANNQGFAISRGNYILMLNPDTLLLNNAIDKMLYFLSEHENIHAAGPKLYYSDKKDYHPSVKKLPTPLNQVFLMFPFAGIFKNFNRNILFRKNKVQKVECICGAAILFKKLVFEKIGFLDEAFFIYSEEVDFCKRMQEHGLNLFYFPKAEIIHYGGKSQEKSNVKKVEYIWKSLLIYFDKYFSKKNVKISTKILYIVLKIKSFFNRNENEEIICSLVKKK